MRWTYCLASAVGLFVVCAVASASAQQKPAQQSGPPVGYQLKSDYTEKSPDGAIVIEQYAKDDPDNGFAWEFWVRRGGTMSLLNAKPADYPADFRFTNDAQWLIRTQKTGAGYADLYLYRLTPSGFAPTTKKPLSALAWAYFYSRPEAKTIEKPNLHIAANLVKGIADNYKSLGESWPANRYIVITLSGELDPTAQHGQTLEVQGWHVRYDLQTGTFDVPPDFAANNTKALIPKDLSKS